MAIYKWGDRVQLHKALSVQKAGRMIPFQAKGTIRGVMGATAGRVATYTVEFDDARPLVIGVTEDEIHRVPAEDAPSNADRRVGEGQG